MRYRYLGKRELYNKSKTLAAAEDFPLLKEFQYKKFHGCEWLSGEDYKISSQFGGRWIKIIKIDWLDDNAKFMYRYTENLYSDTQNNGNYNYHSTHEWDGN